MMTDRQTNQTLPLLGCTCNLDNYQNITIVESVLSAGDVSGLRIVSSHEDSSIKLLARRLVSH